MTYGTTLGLLRPDVTHACGCPDITASQADAACRMVEDILINALAWMLRRRCQRLSPSPLRSADVGHDPSGPVNGWDTLPAQCILCRVISADEHFKYRISNLDAEARYGLPRTRRQPMPPTVQQNGVEGSWSTMDLRQHRRSAQPNSEAIRPQPGLLNK